MKEFKGSLSKVIVNDDGAITIQQIIKVNFHLNDISRVDLILATFFLPGNFTFTLLNGKKHIVNFNINHNKTFEELYDSLVEFGIEEHSRSIVKTKNEIKREEKIATKQRIEENRKNAIACCPKCGSTSLSAHKKGFGIGKAIVGGAVFGPFGLVGGNINAKKVRVTCLNCGHQHWAGKR